METKISFIHAADLHLDSPFKGLANIPSDIFHDIRQSTFTALEKLVSIAIEKKVDFVLITGDLFDNENQSLKAQIRLRKEFEKLEKHHINVYLSYGNHDHINGNIHPITYPSNVHIFPDEKVRHFIYTKNGHDVAAIYGFSYENRSVTHKKVQDYNITDEQVPFHIAMLHGSLQSNTEHDTYAPFQISELTEKHFDYWALGHIHQREILKSNPPIIYPGNIQGRHRKESGEKGCYHVTLTKSEANFSFIPLQTLQFTPLRMDVSQCEEIHLLESMINDELDKQLDKSVPHLIDLTLEGENPMFIQWKNEGFLEDVIELVNESLIHQKNWNYIFRLSMNINQASTESIFQEGDHFIGELTRHMNDTSIWHYMNDLYQHKQARRYLDSISESEEETIKQEAKELLYIELLKE